MKHRTEDQFARVLGKPRTKGTTSVAVFVSPEEMAETFGPPEMKNLNGLTLLLWNFTNADGKEIFSAFVAFVPTNVNSAETIEIRIISKRNPVKFREWLIGRLSETAHGERAPLFIGASQFVCAHN